MSLRRAFLLGLLLVGLGAAVALYAISHWESGARALGLEPASDAQRALTPPDREAIAPDFPAPPPPAAPREDGDVEQRVSSLERAIVRAEGSAGRADGLLIAFAARRAIERGLPLGYLEPLLTDRFGRRHEAAVSQLVSGARDPILLKELVADYERLGAVLREPPPDTSLVERFRSGLSGLVTIYPANQPSPRPRARYERALVELRLGNVDSALAETMRLPGADSAGDWVAKARKYVATQRALDEIEAAALLSREDFATDR